MRKPRASVVLVGLAAAAACGAAWALLIALSRQEIGFAAVGVGWAVSRAVREAADGETGRPLQWTAAGCTALGLLLGKYFYVAHLLREMAARAPQSAPNGPPGWFDPHIAVFFVSLLPRLLGLYDALWVFLALYAAWRALEPGTTAP